MWSTGGGSTDVQYQALMLRHLNTSTYFTAVFQQVDLHALQHYLNLLAIPYSGRNSDFPSPRFLCLEGCLHAVFDQTTECILSYFR